MAELTPDEFVELCRKMKALGVGRFVFAGYDVAFFPPESFPTIPIVEPAEETEEPETGGTKREIIRREMARHEQDLYGG